MGSSQPGYQAGWAGLGCEEGGFIGRRGCGFWSGIHYRQKYTSNNITITEVKERKLQNSMCYGTTFTPLTINSFGALYLAFKLGTASLSIIMRSRWRE